jgi:hypothetical protein
VLPLVLHASQRFGIFHTSAVVGGETGTIPESRCRLTSRLFTDHVSTICPLLPGFGCVEEDPQISYSTYRALSSGLRSNVNPHVHPPVLNVPEQRFVTLLALSFSWQWRFWTSVGDHDLPVSLRKKNPPVWVRNGRLYTSNTRH